MIRTHHFATRLRFDLYTFWEIFEWVLFLEFLCRLQQFWACKFTVLLCLSVRWRELKRREEFESVCVRMTIFWSSCGEVWRHQVLHGDGDGADIYSHCRVRRLVWLTTKLLCVECVAVSTIAPVCYTRSNLHDNVDQGTCFNANANSSETAWPNYVEVGELLQYYRINTVINFLFKEIIAELKQAIVNEWVSEWVCSFLTAHQHKKAI